MFTVTAVDYDYEDDDNDDDDEDLVGRKLKSEADKAPEGAAAEASGGRPSCTQDHKVVHLHEPEPG